MCDAFPHICSVRLTKYRLGQNLVEIVGGKNWGDCWTSSTGMTPRHQLAKKNKQIERDKQISSRCPHMLSPMLKQKLMMMMMIVMVMVMVMVMMMAVLMKIKIMMGMPQKCSTKIKGGGKKNKKRYKLFLRRPSPNRLCLVFRHFFVLFFLSDAEF